MQASYLLSPTLVEHVHQALDITNAGQIPAPACVCIYTCIYLHERVAIYQIFDKFQ
jgi:hypothetical protein